MKGLQKLLLILLLYCVGASITYGNAIEFAIDEQEALQNAKLYLMALNKEKFVTQEELKLKDCALIPDGNNGSFYLFNFDDNCGFALVSGDRRDGVDVFAASSQINLSLEDLTNDNSLGLLLKMIIDYHFIRVKEKPNTPNYKVRNNVNIQSGSDYHTETTVDTTYMCGPLVNYQWHQNYPFNRYQPNYYPLGCGPLAIGQIMARYQRPASVTVGLNNYTFDWNFISMVHNETDANFNIVGTAEVSQFLLSIGEFGGAIYGPDGTSFPRNSIKSTFNHYGYNCVRADYNYHAIYNEITYNYRPALIVGTDVEHGAHAWIADGILRTLKIEQDYDDETGEPLEDTFLDIHRRTYSYEYLLVNWGWGDLESPLLHSSQRTIGDAVYPIIIYSDIFSIGSYDFSTQLEMWYQIYPLD